MIRCPKCGCREISGPIYHDGSDSATGRESLAYACRACGYMEHKPCLDASKAAPGAGEERG